MLGQDRGTRCFRIPEMKRIDKVPFVLVRHGADLVNHGPASVMIPVANGLLHLISPFQGETSVFVGKRVVRENVRSDRLCI